MVEFRCVMPNTIDAKSANTTAAEKCDKFKLKFTASSQRNVMRIRRRDKVQQAGGDQKGLAVIRRGIRRHDVAPVHDARQK